MVIVDDACGRVEGMLVVGLLKDFEVGAEW